ncbi:peptide-N4-(N-acetyl-beta-glucosaminyl)asparagine amidase A-like [Punica granatum]|uniref:Peptide-N4-(N-acetyl-beta- glucosaminyl)asparagine amidase A-like n=2 Tax=Punica granatum TaxID=22663 RepID=A0A6P8DZ86_PUNGR|nr:peptide-N4-(N-acetyl-beta-glucosaminyl)asparagine amidase A-like [Punica granatum]XP_031397694.1 peptide-N4-(N-acetyl-beta-glucosaminyl)asparagine amidase A-like [Punica granatum]XP_031397703.1 peptide-N4-(N-acetyl-beta-glucosaminyl)asparagine amidase A-like [Punica granatum]XP_031397714.1 peptide-N4-(N-acetyl-beta-glucosaminyl)asparagine amidase A-like [Punica granatum]XP_031397723.1 peptide-N4-(N-acetyl-beta-glucosaminyl)asparagine amidase A-like [Punica granatum]XP_031397732.1 peptide-N4
MAPSSSTFLLLLFLSLLLHRIPFAAANNLRRSKSLALRRGLDPTSDTALTTNLTAVPPYRYFEVTKPIHTPPTKPCSYLVLRHQFAYTYGKPPVLTNYTPPSDHGCPSREFSKIVLEWTATCRGVQYDRIFGVWLGGVELLRSCTAEPRATGIIWTVQKDITRYHSLLMENSTLAVYLGNIVTKTYTGIYDVNITMHFYPAAEKSVFDGLNWGYSVPGYGSWADLILPISRNLPLKDGLWFEIENATDTESKKFSIPQNVYRAVLEVYVSFHGDDEFWYANYPNEYIEANNLTSADGNGPFREVVVTLDGEIVGSVWPFTVIFTGGINPLFWRPITGIGSFDLPSYDIEITPFLSKILDGEVHELGFSVTNALDVWYIDANLHIWVDEKSKKTTSKLLSYSGAPLLYSSKLDFKGLDGKFLIKANRSISATGWVNSSYGNITTRWTQKFNFSNCMILGNEANMQIVNQLIHYDDRVDLKTESSSVKSIHSYKKFPFVFYINVLDQGKGAYLEVANVTFAFNENKGRKAAFGVSKSKLRNVQKANGYMVVKNNLVVSGLGTMAEVFKYNSSRDCYFRNVSSSNYTILYDDVESSCDGGIRQFPLRFGLNRHATFSF